MKIIEAHVVFQTLISEPYNRDILGRIEVAGRVCYKSEAAITAESAAGFVRRIIERGHESVLEHVSVTVRFVVDRGVSHELVRHRLCAFSQESTRYCNYAAEKFGNEITVVRPVFWPQNCWQFYRWKKACEEAETSYFALIEHGQASPQEARSVLPNSLKTEVVTTANLREWRHILRLRTSKAAHPQMRQVMVPLLQEFRHYLPSVFSDIPEVA